MSLLAQPLLAASAAIGLIAGALHLHSTFFGPDLRPEDPELQVRMQAVPLNLTSRTTMWGAWIGFNAILSLGVMLFGLVYGYLAIVEFAFLQGSPFLLAIGGTFLAGSVALFKRYTYYLPALVFSLALALYVGGAAAALS